MSISYWMCRYDDEIRRVTADRVTDKSIWIEGRRVPLVTDWTSYHASWEDARDFLLQEAKGDALTCQRQLNKALERVTRIQAMKQPSPVAGDSL